MEVSKNDFDKFNFDIDKKIKIINNLYFDWKGIFYEFDPEKNKEIDGCDYCGAPWQKEIIDMIFIEILNDREKTKKLSWCKRLFNKF